MTRPLQVFLCHASQDKPEVRELYKRLKTEDWIDPWLDEEKITLGAPWTTVIENALDDADIVIIFLSKNSVQKEGFVQRELNYAWDLSLEKPRETIFLIPFRLDNCEIPRHLRSRQWGDYFGEKKENTYQVLLRSLKQRHLQRLQIETAEKAESERVELEKQKRESENKAIVDVITHNLQNFIEDLEKEEPEEVRPVSKIEEKKEQPKPFTKVLKPASLNSQKKSLETKENKPNYNFRRFGIGGIIFIGILGILFAGNYFLNNIPASETPEITPTEEITVTSTFEPTTTATNSLAISTTTRLDIGSTTLGNDGMTLMYVPAGEFTMGSDDGESDERPEHQVYLDAFWIDQTEVTNEQYALCVNAGSCNSPEETKLFLNSGYANHPVVYVSWEDAKTYCQWAERRLPTEAEWEKAARGTEGNIYPWGNIPPESNFLNYNGKMSGTTKVGNYPVGVSIYGALDMAGNVWEWVSSLYEPYPYDSNDGREDLSSTHLRVVRGGSWAFYNAVVRSAFRYDLAPSYAYASIGFRCAMDADQ